MMPRRVGITLIYALVVFNLLIAFSLKNAYDKANANAERIGRLETRLERTSTTLSDGAAKIAALSVRFCKVRRVAVINGLIYHGALQRLDQLLAYHIAGMSYRAALEAGFAATYKNDWPRQCGPFPDRPKFGSAYARLEK